MARSLLALGSNLGDRQQTLDKAVREIASSAEIDVVQVSRWFRTSPAGGPEGQGEFLNGAAIVETIHEPSELLEVVHAIEKKFGRERKIRWAERTLDIDILLYEDRVVGDPDLEIPHPRMAERRFVLEPAAEIAPDWDHPLLGKTIAELLCELDDPSGPRVE